MLAKKLGARVRLVVKRRNQASSPRLDDRTFDINKWQVKPIASLTASCDKNIMQDIRSAHLHSCASRPQFLEFFCFTLNDHAHTTCTAFARQLITPFVMPTSAVTLTRVV
jgi:hypothetical protein